MARFVSVVIVALSFALSLAGCVERTVAPPLAFEPAPQPQTGEQLATLTKAQYEAWTDCALTAAGKYLSANESAPTVARAAMTACRSQERDLVTAMTAYNQTRMIPADVIAQVRGRFTEKLTQMIIDRRQDIKLAKAYSEEWTDCLVSAAGDLARRDIPLKDAVMQSYRTCSTQEDAVRKQLTNLTSNPAAEIERRKGRVAQILAKFVQEVRSGGADRPKRPDMSI